MIRISLGLAAIIIIAVIALHGHIGNAPNLLKTPSDLKYWQWLQYNDGQSSGTVKSEDGAIRVDVLSVGSIDWALMLFQRSVVLKNGQSYRLTFTAKADKVRLIGVKTTRPNWMADYGTTGLSDEFTIGKEWKTFTTVFTAKNADTIPGRAPMFILAQTTGTVWLKDIMVQEAN